MKQVSHHKECMGRTTLNETMEQVQSIEHKELMGATLFTILDLSKNDFLT